MPECPGISPGGACRWSGLRWLYFAKENEPKCLNCPFNSGLYRHSFIPSVLSDNSVLWIIAASSLLVSAELNPIVMIFKPGVEQKEAVMWITDGTSGPTDHCGPDGSCWWIVPHRSSSSSLYNLPPLPHHSSQRERRFCRYKQPHSYRFRKAPGFALFCLPATFVSAG